jgi:hypothetical protein
VVGERRTFADRRFGRRGLRLDAQARQPLVCAPQQFALASGLALVFGVVGGVIAGVPLRMLIEAWGWRSVMGVSAALTACWRSPSGCACATIPATALIDSHAHSATHGSGHHARSCSGMAEVLSYRNTWILLITPIGIAGAVLTFAGLWGVPYLRQVHGLDTHSAAAITSLLLIAWAIGGPRPRYPLRTHGPPATALCLDHRRGARRLGWWSSFAPIPIWLLIITLLVHRLGLGQPDHRLRFCQGIGAGPPDGHGGGICNMGPLLGGMLLQPAVGWVLDRSLAGCHGGWVPPLRRRRLSGRIQPAGRCLVISLCLIPFAKETACQQSK